MPSPLQLREQNIKQLLEALKGENTPTTTDVYNKTTELFPSISQKRLKDYAQTVIRMMKTQKKME
ncbi:unnamed protein product [marine sediment metagenome]|uniref:Uncharacterized protein n=1 Tax=marine sediment metagenome TaxID=412755 RepID=X1T1Z6_9ZZZZ